jgi:hypothetical protein
LPPCWSIALLALICLAAHHAARAPRRGWHGRQGPGTRSIRSPHGSDQTLWPSAKGRGAYRPTR